ncbi:MAG: hypothetical protein OIF40_10550 [Mangrovicoccus sp.]|nr:hypothetical protein [Mangrovicoccus sp.]
MSGAEAVSRGVDTLIAKLRDDGVAAGLAEADKITAAAKAEAAQIIAAAKAEGEKYLAETRKSADNYRAAGEEALNTAMRDAILTMKSRLMTQFALDVRRMVRTEANDPEMLKQMVLELVGRARAAADGGDGVDVILPAEIVGPAAIAENPEEIQSGQLTKFVLGLNKSMLEDGVELHAADDLQGGIRARVKGKDLELDLSEEAIAALIMQHLQPRFRAVMEGVIK